MFIPYKVDVPMQRWPIANFVLMGATILISIGLFGPLDTWDLAHSPHGEYLRQIVGVELPYDPLVDHFLLQPGHFRVTQLVGHLFLHADIFHLAGNILFLWVFGNAVNAKLGNLTYVGLYLGIGIFEGCVWLLAGPGNPCLGASGAIMGIVGAFVLLYPMNSISVAYWLFLVWYGVWEISAMWVIAVYVAFDVWGLIRSAHTGVAYLAHVVGFATGAGVATALLRLKWVEMCPNEKSLLQIWNLMPEKDEAPPQRMAAAVLTRQAARSPTNVPGHPTSGGVGRRPSAPPRPKRDDGPIPFD
jgi:membrane associated rhomboid family serine protease